MKAIAVTPIWNHVTKTLISPNDEFEMDSASIQSLIEVGAAKPYEPRPPQANTNTTPKTSAPTQSSTMQR